jgi:hypothetical protein
LSATFDFVGVLTLREDLSRPSAKRCTMADVLGAPRLEIIEIAAPFQADYKGLIPFTLSNDRLLAQIAARVADVRGPFIFRQPEEHRERPRVFPQLLGEIPPPFTPEGWGKGSASPESADFTGISWWARQGLNLYPSRVKGARGARNIDKISITSLICRAMDTT